MGAKIIPSFPGRTGTGKGSQVALSTEVALLESDENLILLLLTLRATHFITGPHVKASVMNLPNAAIAVNFILAARKGWQQHTALVLLTANLRV